MTTTWLTTDQLTSAHHRVVVLAQLDTELYQHDTDQHDQTSTTR